jgi:hypothetical protein
MQEAPEGPLDLGFMLGQLVQVYCAQEQIPWREEGQPFLKSLQREVMANLDDPIDEVAQRLWTSAQVSGTLRSDSLTLAFPPPLFLLRTT